MSEKILVTYASRTGSTAGVAEAIGKNLANEGETVDVLPMQEVSDLTQYKVVIAGSAIQSQRWLPEAIQFIKTYQKILSSKPFGIFSVCMTLAMPNGEKYRSGMVKWLDPVRQLVKPIDEGYFAGVLDISKIPGLSNRIKFRLSVKFGIWKPGDHRNWNAINDWAKNLKIVLNV